MGHLLSPNGTLIVATCDTVLATASFDPNNVEIDTGVPMGFDLSWSGDTKVHWDTQETRATPEGDLWVQDDDGTEFLLSKCTFHEGEHGIEDDEDEEES